MPVIIVRLAAAGAAAAAAFLAAAPTAAADAPKPGLWAMTYTADALPRPMTSKSCVGVPKPGETPFVPPPQSGMNCTKASTTKTAAGIATAVTCTVEGMTMAMTGLVTGDLTTNYIVTMKTRMSGPDLPPEMTGDHLSKITATYLGACPAGMAVGTAKPG